MSLLNIELVSSYFALILVFFSITGLGNYLNLKYFKIKKLDLITNNPEKIEYLKNNKIKVDKIIKIKPGINSHNLKYLETKKNIGKHLLKL